MLHQLSALVPVYIVILGTFGGLAFGGFVTYVILSWLGRTNASGLDKAARVFVGILVIPTYIVSVVVGMVDHTYSIPWQLHGIFGSIVMTLFPKQILRMGKNGYEIGFGNPPDKSEAFKDNDDVPKKS